MNHIMLYAFSLCVSFLLLISGCSDSISAQQSAFLSLSLESISFPHPVDINDQPTVNIMISNTGNDDLLISSLSVIEEDEVRDVILLDADDWSTQVTIRAGGEKSFTLQWNVIDYISDRGLLRIESNVGSKEIAWETPDLDAVFEIKSQLNPQLNREDAVIRMSKQASEDQINIKNI